MFLMAMMIFWFTHMVDMWEGIDVCALQHVVLPDHAVAVRVRLVGFLRGIKRGDFDC